MNGISYGCDERHPEDLVCRHPVTLNTKPAHAHKTDKNTPYAQSKIKNPAVMDKIREVYGKDYECFGLPYKY